MNVEQYHIAKLADVMYAAGSTLSERVAVGCVIRNRALTLGSWHDAIESLSYRQIKKNPHSPDFLSTLWAADEVFYNRRPDITHGAEEFSDYPSHGAVNVGLLFFQKTKKAGSEIITTDLVEVDALEVFESD